jgi:hypothetical protein
MFVIILYLVPHSLRAPLLLQGDSHCPSIFRPPLPWSLHCSVSLPVPTPVLTPSLPSCTHLRVRHTLEVIGFDLCWALGQRRYWHAVKIPKQRFDYSGIVGVQASPPSLAQTFDSGWVGSSYASLASLDQSFTSTQTEPGKRVLYLAPECEEVCFLTWHLDCARCWQPELLRAALC